MATPDGSGPSLLGSLSLRVSESEPTHSCLKCDAPIQTYGRLAPCNHFYCYDCAKELPQCPLCQTEVSKVNIVGYRSLIYVCLHPGCLRSYLSKYSLNEHQRLRQHTGLSLPPIPTGSPTSTPVFVPTSTPTPTPPQLPQIPPQSQFPSAQPFPQHQPPPSFPSSQPFSPSFPSSQPFSPPPPPQIPPQQFTNMSPQMPQQFPPQPPSYPPPPAPKLVAPDMLAQFSAALGIPLPPTTTEAELVALLAAVGQLTGQQAQPQPQLQAQPPSYRGPPGPFR